MTEEPLFILDGLDEVVRDLHTDDDIYRLLMSLLNQPDVIITSRPYGNLPSNLRSPSTSSSKRLDSTQIRCGRNISQRIYAIHRKPTKFTRSLNIVCSFRVSYGSQFN